MISEEQWLRISQSFPSKADVEAGGCEKEEAVRSVKSSEESSLPPSCVIGRGDTMGAEGSVPNDRSSSMSPEVARMREFLRQRARKGKERPPPITAHFVDCEPHISGDVKVVNAMATMESKLKSLASRLLSKNEKVEEQEMKIANLERKLAVCGISGSVAIDETKGHDHTESIHRHFHVISVRLTKLESQMEGLMQATRLTDNETFPFLTNHEKSSSHLEFAQEKNERIKPRGNLASAYRMHSHALKKNSNALANEKLDKDFVEEKISNLEKVVETLKHFMFSLILKKGYKS